jgi:hypothetical protein
MVMSIGRFRPGNVEVKANGHIKRGKQSLNELVSTSAG